MGNQMEIHRGVWGEAPWKIARCLGRVGLSGALFNDLGSSLSWLEPPNTMCVGPLRRGSHQLEKGAWGHMASTDEPAVRLFPDGRA